MHALAALLAQLPDPGNDNGGGTDGPLLVAGIVSIGLGILIFAVPRLLSYIVAAYLVVIGVIWLVAAF
ncbi:MAG TPA: DUF3096 domain-containing protein [Gaiellaceae bacterium]|nr:DUF3096 domain-containing protein [Gaiellaceae bacterium]